MSPVARSDRHAGKAVLVAGIGVTLALGLAWLFAVLASRGDVDVQLGDERFEVGRVENLASQIGEGGPLVFQDLTFDGRDIYVQHLGSSLDGGWYAIGAFDPNDRSCIIEWKPERELFVNQCDRSSTYPPDGTGLRRYETSVLDGDLVVDLNALARQADEQESDTSAD